LRVFRFILAKVWFQACRGIKSRCHETSPENELVTGFLNSSSLDFASLVVWSPHLWIICHRNLLRGGPRASVTRHLLSDHFKSPCDIRAVGRLSSKSASKCSVEGKQAVLRDVAKVGCRCSSLRGHASSFVAFRCVEWSVCVATS